MNKLLSFVFKSFLILLLTFTLSTKAVLAQDKTQSFDAINIQLTAETQTNGTGRDGERDSNISEWDKYEAPERYYISEDTATVSVQCTRGQTRDDIEYYNYFQILPGVIVPRSVRVRVWAKSPKVPPVTNVGVKGCREITYKATAYSY